MGYLSDIYEEDASDIDDVEAYAAAATVLEDDDPQPKAKVSAAPKNAGAKAVPYIGTPSESDDDAYQRIMAMYPDDPVGALFRFCFERNVFYHEKWAKQFAESKDDAILAAMPQPYLDEVTHDPATAGLDFFSQIKRENFEKAYSEDLTILSLSAEDRRNRQQVLSIVNYDPFAEEPIEDRPQMYRDAAGLLTDAMRRDIPRRNAAIEVVHDYTTIARYQRRLALLEASGQDDKETRDAIDNCIKMISKMQDTINKLTKENGFSSGKAIGANGRGGLSDVMKMCEEKGYDPAAPNIYDIETSRAIAEVAEISTRAMLNQVNLSSTDYAEILTSQCQKVLEYREAALKALEAARLAEEKLEKEAILHEYRMELEAKGIDPNDILEMVNQEIRMYDGGRD